MKALNLITIAIGIVCFALTKWLPDQATTLVGIGAGLVMWGMPQPKKPDQTITIPQDKQVGSVRLLPMLALALCSFGATSTLLLAPACKTTPVTPDQIFGAVVDCAKVNPEASAALAAVETCLVGALSSNYAVCLTGLVTAGKFSIDEVACVVAWYAQQTQAKVASSTASLEELAARQRANDWLAHEEIAIRNSYAR